MLVLVGFVGVLFHNPPWVCSYCCRVPASLASVRWKLEKALVKTCSSSNTATSIPSALGNACVHPARVDKVYFPAHRLGTAAAGTKSLILIQACPRDKGKDTSLSCNSRTVTINIISLILREGLLHIIHL